MFRSRRRRCAWACRMPSAAASERWKFLCRSKRFLGLSNPAASACRRLSPIRLCASKLRRLVMDRRDFLKKTAAAGLFSSLETRLAHAADASVPKRTLGHTGEKVSMVGIGGFHLGHPSEEEAIRIVRTALDEGVNFLDNCWDYNGGVSEERMGKALADGYRQKAFLMTKIDGQTKTAAAQQLDESLRRLKTDHIDLLQFHEVIRDTDPARIFGPAGGIEAVVEAKKQGKVRYIGFTGHKSPEIHNKMLETAFAHQF